MALVLEVLLDNKGAVHGIKQLSGEVEKLGPTTQKTSSSILSSFNSVKGFIAGAVVTSVVLLAKKVFSLASEFVNLASVSVETSNKFNTLFKGVGGINTAVVDLSKQTGYASSSIQTFIADLGAIIKPAGFTSQAAFNLSKKITELSLDLGSFHNYAPQQVMEDFRSALAGSSETLQKYGINVKEGALAVEAYKMGLTSSVKEYEKLDAVTKQNIRTQALVSKAFKDASDAVGDLSKTQDTYANQSRMLDESLKEMSERLGVTLIQMFTGLIQKSNELLKNIMDIAGLEADAEKMARYEKSYKPALELLTCLIHKLVEKPNFEEKRLPKMWKFSNQGKLIKNGI